jgi:hypothetical protein
MTIEPNSTHERILQRVDLALKAAGTDAASRVHRGRVDAFGVDEIPAINIRRSTGQADAFAQAVHRGLMEFELDFHVRGDDWETAADRLHLQAHRVIAIDAGLNTLGRGLRCVRTEPRAEGGDETIGRLTATYQVQALTRAHDMALVT